jgi:hypothetical protein
MPTILLLRLGDTQAFHRLIREHFLDRDFVLERSANHNGRAYRLVAHSDNPTLSLVVRQSKVESLADVGPN